MKVSEIILPCSKEEGNADKSEMSLVMETDRPGWTVYGEYMDRIWTAKEDGRESE